MLKKKTSRRGGRKPGKWIHLTDSSLKQFRQDSSLSRPKLAEMLGVSPTSIQNWETGKSVPMKRYQEILADMIAGGAPPAAESADSSRERASPRVATTSNGPVHAARLTATGEIMKGYLATSQGGKVTREQLVSLTKALSAALA